MSTTKRRPTPKAAALPPPLSDEAVRLAALTCLLSWATGDPFPTHRATTTFQLPRDTWTAPGVTETAEQVFARLVANGRSPVGIMAALALHGPEVAWALLNLCRGARVDWTPRRAVA